MEQLKTFSIYFLFLVIRMQEKWLVQFLLFCRKDGNPFNSSAAPLSSPTPSAPSPQSPFFGGGGSSSNSTPSDRTPVTQAAGPSTTTVESKSSNKSSTKRIVWIVISVVLSAVILALALALIIPVCLKRRDENDRISKRPDAVEYDGRRENARENSSLVLPPSHTEKGMSNTFGVKYFNSLWLLESICDGVVP